MTKVKKRWLPLHEWLVARIKDSSVWEMSEIGSQIMEIEISKDHIDKIIRAWKRRFKELATLDALENNHFLNVVADLLEQKNEAEEKAMVEVKQVETTPVTPAPDAEVDVDWPDDDDHSFGTHIKEAINAIKGQ